MDEWGWIWDRQGSPADAMVSARQCRHLANKFEIFLCSCDRSSDFNSFRLTCDGQTDRRINHSHITRSAWCHALKIIRKLWTCPKHVQSLPYIFVVAENTAGITNNASLFVVTRYFVPVTVTTQGASINTDVPVPIYTPTWLDPVLFIISAKWTEWNWRIYCFHFCVRVYLCVCVCVCTQWRAPGL